MDASPQLALLVYFAALRKPSAVFLWCLPVNLLSLVVSCTELCVRHLRMWYILCVRHYFTLERK